MIQPYRPYFRTLLISACALTLVVAGCNKKPQKAAPSTYTPPPAAVKPTVSLSADKTTINPGESAKLTWTSTDANNVSIAPEVGAVTAQGTTTVTPAKSTTYTVTASGPGGNADATVSIAVNTPHRSAKRPRPPPSTNCSSRKSPTRTSITIPPNCAPTLVKPSRKMPPSSSNIPPCASPLRATATNVVPPNTTSRSASVAPMPSCSILSALASRKAGSTPPVGVKKSPSAWKPPKPATPRTDAATSSKPNNN